MSCQKLGILKLDRVLQKQLKQLAKQYLAYRVWNTCVIFIDLLIFHLKISSHLYNESLRTRIVLSLINKIFLFSVCEVSSKSEIILCKYRKLNIARIFMIDVF